MPRQNLQPYGDFYINDFLSKNSKTSLDKRLKLFSFDINLKGSDPLFEKSTGPFYINYEDDPDSFFKSMNYAVILAQYSAALPVSGGRGSNYKRLQFSWFNFNILCWTLSFVGNSFHFICFMRYAITTGIYTGAASVIIFFGSSFIACILMLQLAYNWKKLCQDFAVVELKLKKLGYPKKIGCKLKSISVLFTVLGLGQLLVEVFPFFLNTLYDQHKGDVLSLMNSFFLDSFREVFHFYHYNPAIGFLLLVSNIRVVIVWILQDLFLGCISYSISERFKQIHNLLESVHGKEMPLTFWREIRENFNELAVLTKRTDQHTQKLMFFAMGHDLFYLCITLFNSLQIKASLFGVISLSYSLTVHLIRVSFVIFSAARINEESKQPRITLFSVPQKNYSTEVKRFITQCSTNEIALTGWGFFSITRSLILTIIGSMITYEIVLVQFDLSKKEGNINYNETYVT